MPAEGGGGGGGGGCQQTIGAKRTAVHEAARLVSTDETQPSHAVFQTDSKSAIQSLQ